MCSGLLVSFEGSQWKEHRVQRLRVGIVCLAAADETDLIEGTPCGLHAARHYVVILLHLRVLDGPGVVVIPVTPVLALCSVLCASLAVIDINIELPHSEH